MSKLDNWLICGIILVSGTIVVLIFPKNYQPPVIVMPPKEKIIQVDPQCVIYEDEKGQRINCDK